MQKSFQKFIVIIIFLISVMGCSSRSLQIKYKRVESLSSDPLPEISQPTPSPSLAQTKTFSLEIETLTPALPPDQNQRTSTIIAFTGVIVPARCVQEEVSFRGSADYLYAEVREILTGADIAVGVFNATMRDGVEYMGCVRSWELIGSTNNADALARAGFDVMSVATNHIKDCGFFYCGDEGFFSTLENFERVGIHPVGAGESLKEALKPAVVEVNGIRFGFVSLGEVNERVFADQGSAGIAFLSNRNLEEAITQLEGVVDVIIVLPHSGPEDFPEVTAQQKYWARHSVEYGADLVVMNHAHILQGYQYIKGVPVFYSLGNFVFDQSWARDHQQAVILLVEFIDKKFASFELIPTIVEQNGTVHLAKGIERDEILDRMESLSAALLPFED